MSTSNQPKKEPKKRRNDGNRRAESSSATRNPAVIASAAETARNGCQARTTGTELSTAGPSRDSQVAATTAQTITPEVESPPEITETSTSLRVGQSILPAPENGPPAGLQNTVNTSAVAGSSSGDAQSEELDVLLRRVRAKITIRSRNMNNVQAEVLLDASVSIRNPVHMRIDGLHPPEELEMRIDFAEQETELSGASESVRTTSTSQAQSSTVLAPTPTAQLAREQGEYATSAR
jgi:tellurite resistance protein